jgi:hypothetical protein
VPSGALEDARAELDTAAREHARARAAVGRTGDRPLLVSKTRLTRLVCDGLQRDPVPYEHAWANVRGTLAHATIEAAVADPVAPSIVLARRVWERAASERPGDPASLSAWLNVRTAEDRDLLMAEVAALVDAFREVWPEFDGRVVVSAERRVVLTLDGGAVRLQGVPDLVVASPRMDDRARALVVDLKTGMPRPQEDRDELRFYALLVALATGAPPFRWATLYVAEGRYESEDLTTDLLEAVTRRVVDAIGQATRLLVAARPDAPVGDASGGPEERLSAGLWCRGCTRAAHCPVRSAAVSQGADMLAP